MSGLVVGAGLRVNVIMHGFMEKAEDRGCKWFRDGDRTKAVFCIPVHECFPLTFHRVSALGFAHRVTDLHPPHREIDHFLDTILDQRRVGQRGHVSFQVCVVVFQHKFVDVDL